MTTVSIITPTIGKDLSVLKRCLYSVRGQTYPYYEHIVCSDGRYDDGVWKLLTCDLDTRVTYGFTVDPVGHYGAGVRQHVMNGDLRGDYLCFLDDDNILFPDYLERMVAALDANPEAGFAISKTIHLGPLPAHLGTPPQVISGIPPRLQNIDTIQVMVRKHVMIDCGWQCVGYMSDGYTFERLAKMASYAEVPHILSAHL